MKDKKLLQTRTYFVVNELINEYRYQYCRNTGCNERALTTYSSFGERTRTISIAMVEEKWSMLLVL